MASWQLDDLLTDELAGNDPVGRWEHALQTMFLRVDPATVSRFRMRELAADASKAVEHLQAMMTQAETLGFLRKVDPDSELITFAAGLAQASEALSEGSGRSFSPTKNEIYMGLLSAVDDEVFQILDRQTRLYQTMSARVTMIDQNMKDRFASALDALEDGLEEVGTDRITFLREARYEANVAAGISSANGCLPISLIGAFAEWKMTRSVGETQRLLRRVWPEAEKEGALMTYLIGRMLGNVEMVDEDFRGAWIPLVTAAEVEDDPDVVLEACCLAIRLKKWEQAQRLVERGAVLSTLFLIRLLASPLADQIAGDVLTAIVNRQRTIRRQVGGELSAWNEEMHRIKQAQKRADIELPFLATYENTRKSLAQRISKADLIASMCLIQQVISNRLDCMRFASEIVGEEHRRAGEELDLAKSGITQAWAERDAMVDAAVREQRVATEKAREALRHSLSESERNYSGCVVGFGSGCAAFILYLMIAAFLAMRGVEAGFGTVFGWFGLAATGIPIGFTIVIQLAYGIQRAALDSALHDQIKATQVAYDAAVKKADDFYREKVLHLRGGLNELEKRVTILSEALSVLNASDITPA